MGEQCNSAVTQAGLKVQITLYRVQLYETGIITHSMMS